jgi:CubicO group peptidase (beta-lactamase class C family)
MTCVYNNADAFKPLEELQQTLACVASASMGSFTAAVVCKDKVFKTSSEKAKENTQFFIGSVSKHMTAYMLLMSLRKKHPRANLEALLRKKLTALFSNSPFLQSIKRGWTSKINLLQLLTHRSGLTEYEQEYCHLMKLKKAFTKKYSETLKVLVEKFPQSQLLKKIQTSSLHYKDFINNLKKGDFSDYALTQLNKPIDAAHLLQLISFDKKKSYSYANSNYLLVGKLIEEMNGKSFDHVFQEMIAHPAGMNFSFAPVSDNYKTLKKSPCGAHLAPNLNKKSFMNMANAVGPGNVIFTRGDLIKWGQYFFKKSSPVIRKMMLKDYGKHPDGHTIHCGLFTLHTKRLDDFIGHDGTMDSFQSFFGYSPQSNTLVITLSNNITDGNKFIKRFGSWLGD